MNKSTALWMMGIGAALSLYDISTTETGATGGALYGTGKPLANMRWVAYHRDAAPAAGTTPAVAAKDYYVSISDVAALFGAYFYFR